MYKKLKKKVSIDVIRSCSGHKDIYMYKNTSILRVGLAVSCPSKVNSSVQTWAKSRRTRVYLHCNLHLSDQKPFSPYNWPPHRGRRASQQIDVTTHSTQPASEEWCDVCRWWCTMVVVKDRNQQQVFASRSQIERQHHKYWLRSTQRRTGAR